MYNCYLAQMVDQVCNFIKLEINLLLLTFGVKRFSIVHTERIVVVVQATKIQSKSRQACNLKSTRQYRQL